MKALVAFALAAVLTAVVYSIESRPAPPQQPLRRLAHDLVLVDKGAKEIPLALEPSRIHSDSAVDLGNGRFLVSQDIGDHYDIFGVVDLSRGRVQTFRRTIRVFGYDGVVLGSRGELLLYTEHFAALLRPDGTVIDLGFGRMFGATLVGETTYLHGVWLREPTEPHPGVELVDWSGHASLHHAFCVTGTRTDWTLWSARPHWRFPPPHALARWWLVGIEDNRFRVPTELPVSVTEIYRSTPDSEEWITTAAVPFDTLMRFNSWMSAPNPSRWECPGGNRVVEPMAGFTEHIGVDHRRARRHLLSPNDRIRVVIPSRDRRRPFVTKHWSRFPRMTRAETPLGSIETPGNLLFSVGDAGDLWAWSTTDSSYAHYSSIEHFRASQKLEWFRHSPRKRREWQLR